MNHARRRFLGDASRGNCSGWRKIRELKWISLKLFQAAMITPERPLSLRVIWTVLNKHFSTIQGLHGMHTVRQGNRWHLTGQIDRKMATFANCFRMVRYSGDVLPLVHFLFFSSIRFHLIPFGSIVRRFVLFVCAKRGGLAWLFGLKLIFTWRQ